MNTENKNLMGNSEFCFPETLSVPLNSKIEKNLRKFASLTPADTQICRGFKEHDLITWELKVQGFVYLGR